MSSQKINRSLLGSPICSTVVLRTNSPSNAVPDICIGVFTCIFFSRPEYIDAKGLVRLYRRKSLV